MANIGVQLMMVKNEIGDQGMYPVLERIAELGYRSVEVSQVATDEANIAGLERAKNELGVEVAAMSVGLKKGSTNTGDALDIDFVQLLDEAQNGVELIGHALSLVVGDLDSGETRNAATGSRIHGH